MNLCVDPFLLQGVLLRYRPEDDIHEAQPRIDQRVCFYGGLKICIALRFQLHFVVDLMRESRGSCAGQEDTGQAVCCLIESIFNRKPRFLSGTLLPFFSGT